MKPTIKPQYGTTYHRDGTVSYWNVYLQQWKRQAARRISDEVLSTLPAKERARIAKMTT